MVGLSPRGSTSHSLSHSNSSVSPTTSLVRALLNFGHNDEPSTNPNYGQEQHDEENEHDSELDNEQEEITLVGASAGTATATATATGTSSSKPRTQAKGKSKATNQDEPSDTIQSLQHLTLDSFSARPTPSPSQVKPPKSLRNLLRSSQHVVLIPSSSTDPNAPPIERHITSWKMADYAYKREPCPFPTRARGLFTERIEGPTGEEQYRIIARGYDKFFNVGEVSWTEWANIPKHSSAPYELTLKSNGCIIFIAALSPSHVLVTSKHSIGAMDHAEVSHSQRGEYWLERHLEKAGKTKEMLARELWDRNLTAVAELCDDSFEEHVLAYPRHLTGLHLHGLNLNLPTLITLPSSSVTEFAKTWGLLPTPYTIFPSVMAVRTYCETVHSLGGIEESNGKITPVEGFVVRGQKRGPGVEKGEAFFWKVKYDEPYLMYREWREVTRKCLAAYPELDGVNPNKVKNDQTKLYLWWVKREIQKDVGRFDSWKQGRGIIKTRDEFLKWREGEEARTVVRSLKGGGKGWLGSDEATIEAEDDRPFDRWLIAPVAVQGCGKTALGLALSHLFGWSHIQSDDFHMKKSGPHFLKAVKGALTTHKVVYADKNNHQIKLRSDLSSTALSLPSPHRCKLIALVYSIDSPSLPRDKLHALCASRIVERGERHQTLRAGALHEGAIWQFLGQWQPFDAALNPGDGAFDLVVPVKAEWSRLEAVREVCRALAAAGVEGVEPAPSEERLLEAIQVAQTWEPSVKKEGDEATAQKTKKGTTSQAPRYYGVSVEVDLEPLLETMLAGERVWEEVKKQKRVELHPHVTLVHEKEIEVEQDKKSEWDKYASLVEDATSERKEQDELVVKVKLGPRVVWDSRAVSIEVSGLEGAQPGLIELGKDRHAHVTVGTIRSDVRPVEGKWLLDTWIRGEKETKEGGEIKCAEIDVVECKGRLAGLR